MRPKAAVFIDLGVIPPRSEDDYKQWYGGAYTDKDLHNQRLHEDIKHSRILGNPGCYPTSAAAAWPRAEAALSKTEGTSRLETGVTGAGRAPTAMYFRTTRRFPL